MITTKSIAFLAALGYGSGIDMPHHQPAILSVIDAVLSPSRLDATQAQGAAEDPVRILGPLFTLELGPWNHVPPGRPAWIDEPAAMQE
jgi:hypothetical protein